MIARIFFALLFIVFGPQAWAQTVSVDRVTRHVGAGTGRVLDQHATAAACLGAVAASAANGKHMCKIEATRSTDPVVTPPVVIPPVVVPPVVVPPVVVPPVATGPALYFFSDCQAGAAADCVPGSNANPGTEAAPKRDLAGINLNALPPGALLFKRGGAWSGFSAALYNLNATPAAPLVFDAYGSGPAPVLGISGNGFGLALGYGQSLPNGGYTIRNLVLDGGGVAQYGIVASKMTRNLSVENVTVRRFQIGVMLHDSTVSNLVLRNSRVEGNSNQGLLGAGNDWTVEGNTFENNGRGYQTHAFYFSASGGNRNLTLRNNTFRNNAQQSGACSSGNITVHGTITGALIEGNTVEAASYVPGCRGISIVAGYPGQEYMRSFVVRGNTVRNTGACVAFNAAPGIVIEGNRCIDTTTNAFALIENPGNGSGGGDDADGGAVIRSNIVCGLRASAGGLIDVRGATLIGNTVRAGADATTGACAL